MTEIPQDDVITNIEIESVVLVADYEYRVPQVSADKFIETSVIAPWEFPLRYIPGDYYNGDFMTRHICPRCMTEFPLPHGVTISSEEHEVGSPFNRDTDSTDTEYIHVEDESIIENIIESDNITVNVEPSIGCRICSLHAYLEDNEFRVLEDWDGRDDGPKAYRKNMIRLKHAREDVYNRMIDIGYPEVGDEIDIE